MKFRQRLFSSQPKLDVTPMADMVFLLLIFFMLSSSLMIEPGIKLKLPKAKTSEIDNENKLILSINKKNQIFVNKRQISLKNLEEELKALYTNRKDKMLVLRADKSVNHGLVVQVLDKAKLAGAKKLALAAEKP